MALTRPALAAVALLVLVLGIAPAAHAASARATGQIVVYKNVANPGGETTARERALGFTASHRYRYAVEGFAARLTPEQVDRLRSDPDVLQVVPDRPVHADSAPIVPGGTLPPGIPRTWAASAGVIRGAAGPAVAVVDTGVDLASADLNVSAGTNCMGSGPPQDDHGHGTHVAGTIAALNNGNLVVGIAPGTHIYAVKVLGSNGAGTVSSIICGLDWVNQNAAALGIKVVNMSLGGVGPIGNCATDVEHAAVCRLVNGGVTVVAAAGNDADPLTSGTSGHVPGAYPEVLTVTAMADTDGQPGSHGPGCGGDADDSAASFSNYGSASDASHMIAAPGDCVLSLTIGGGLTSMSGTSMATPHVAGAAALCIAEGATAGPCAGQSPAGVIATLRSIAQAGANPSNGFAGDPLHPSGPYYGYLLRAAIPPTAVTDPGSASDHDATLAGTIDAAGAASSWWFEYGPTTSYGQSTPTQSAAADADPQAVQAAVSGLESGSTYHYRIVMQTGEWTIRGADGAFSTTGPPPPPPPDTQIDVAPPARTVSSSAQIQFSATPAAGASFECRLDTVVWSACASPYVAAVGDGSHSFAVRATANGKADPTPATTAWIVDTTPPDTFFGGVPPSSTTSTSATFGLGSNEPAVKFECRLDSGAWTACNSPYPLSALAPGDHRFEARAIDALGWVDPTPALYQWTIAGTDSGPAVPFEPMTPIDSAPTVTTAPGSALLPVARVAPRGPVRLDRRRGRISLTLDCRGPGPCAGSVMVQIRGFRVGAGVFRIRAGGKQTLTLRLGAQAARALRRPAPRTAALSLTRAVRTTLEKGSASLLTRPNQQG